MRSRLILLLVLFVTVFGSAPAREYTAFLGTYTGSGPADSRGIYVVRLNGDTGALSTPELVAELTSPEFIALHPDGRALYALTQVRTPEGRNTGAVAAFSLDPATARLTPLNTEGSGRGQFCHIAVDATGRMVMAASYGDPYVASFPIGADGRVGKVASVITHEGPLGPRRDRQEKPHAHSVTLSPDNRLVFAADLGVDRVFAYALNPSDGTLTPHETPFVTVPPGAGPRHTKFSPDGRHFYVLNELDGTVTACRYDRVRGVAEPFQSVSALPNGYTGQASASEIRVHPNGRFVYTGNRVHNSIAVFARDSDTGALRLVELTPSGGDHPRNFALTPDGEWLLCANQNTDNLVVFKVDATTGRLTATGRTAKVAKAVCVLFLP